MGIISAFEFFWRENPALLYGLSLLLGFFAAFHHHPLVFVPFCLLVVPLAWGSFLKLQMMSVRLILCLLLSIFAYCYGHFAYLLPQLEEDGLEGEAIIEISSLQYKSQGFGKRWLYRGTIIQFTDEKNTLIAKNIPFTLSLKAKEGSERIPADKSYFIYARLQQSDFGAYSLKLLPKKPIYPLKSTLNLTEWRFHLKQQFKRFISLHIKDPLNASFLTGLATGEFDDKTLSSEFSRFGLQHLMAISGFHFALIAAVLGFLLRIIPSRRYGACLLLLLISLYFFFLGRTPSVMRAWVMIGIALFGNLIHQKGSSLNALGAALMVCLLIDPLAATTAGFQFSFLTTAAILLYYHVFDTALNPILAKRSLCQVVEMDLLNQHGYCILSTFRQGLALLLAVNASALPLTLYYYHQFPVMGFVYNLFFPFLVSLSMILLLGAFLASMIPFVSEFIHSINDLYTHTILNFTLYLPKSLDIYLQIKQFPLWILAIYLPLLLSSGIILRYKTEKQHDLQDFSFI